MINIVIQDFSSDTNKTTLNFRFSYIFNCSNNNIITFLKNTNAVIFIDCRAVSAGKILG